MVKYIILKVKGGVEEIDVDETPKKNELYKILNGPVTIVGQYDLDKYGNNGIVIIKSTNGCDKNSHKMLPPFDNLIINGDILLNLTNINGESEDITMEYYNNFINTYNYKLIMN